jgi:hypothetical protein
MSETTSNTTTGPTNQARDTRLSSSERRERTDETRYGGLVSAPTEASVSAPLQQMALVDLLDRLLGAGVVISGDLVISLSGVELVQIRLHALIASVRAEMIVYD